MRTFFYILMVLGFFGSGVYLLINKNASKPYEIPFLGESKTDVTSLFNSSEEVKNREKALIGEWEHEVYFRTPLKIYRITGKVEYRENGTYVRSAFLKLYEHSIVGYVREENAHLAYSGGGVIKGKWIYSKEEGGENWIEKVASCKPSPNIHAEARYRNKSICDFDFVSAFNLGEFKTDFVESDIKEFTNNSIQIKEEIFTEQMVKWHNFTKIE